MRRPMSDNRWQRIEATFQQAVELAPEARSAFLAEACTGNEWLRKEVESLLAHYAEDGNTFVGAAETPQCIAHYRISGKLGEGGMGEVYRATDTKLGRDVAIKVLPEGFAADRDRIARFTREAKVLAALNHPNIAAIYGVEDRALIMELVEGRDLHGPLPVATAINYARQIAAALDAAHEKGIVHRDLKPANIRITPDGVVKVLDFGLAKLTEVAGGAPESYSATSNSGGTKTGMILGTPAYMSPEQARGQAIDRRTDIWAFGAILYELLSGKTLFGDSVNVSDSIAAVLTREPDFSALPTATPLRVRHLLEHCLQKDYRLRLQAAGDARILLDHTEPSATNVARRNSLPWTVAAVGLTATLALGLLHFRETRSPAHPVRFEQALPFRNVLYWWDVPAVSPDGSSIAYTGVTSGTRPMLWLRRLDAVQATVLPGTENASRPFWSPDSRFIAYLADGKLKKLDPNAGPPQVLCDAASTMGGAWNRDGLIVLGSMTGPLRQVSSSGGQPRELLPLNAARKETSHGWPSFLPDGKHFLYTSYSSDPGKSATYLGSVDGRESRRILDIASNATFVLPGLIVFGRGPVLMAQPFDPGKLQVAGEPYPLADMVRRVESAQISVYSSSPNGTLVYQPEVSTSTDLQAVWYGRTGKRLGLAGTPRLYRQGALSPDEKRFAAQIMNPVNGVSDIWLLDLTSGILSRMTSDSAAKSTPVWSPDGREILFASNKAGKPNLYRKTVGGGDEQLVHQAAESIYPAAWLRDGSVIFMNSYGKSFYRKTPGRDAQPETLLKTEYYKDEPRVSPDGNWVAYNTNESGRWEVYIAAYPSFTQRRQVSNHGGVQGFWRKDNKELFYIELDGNIVSVPIKPGPALEAGIPEVLFPTRVPVQAQWDQFAVTGDGQRFLVLESLESEAKPFTIVLNWPAIARK